MKLLNRTRHEKHQGGVHPQRVLSKNMESLTCLWSRSKKHHRNMSRTEIGIQSLLPFLKAITEGSNLANFNGLVAAVDAFCWILKAIFLSIPDSEPIESENFYVYSYTSIMCRHVCLSVDAFYYLDREKSLSSPTFCSARWI